MGYQDFYQLNEDEKRTIFNQIAFNTGLPVNAVEKDWWIVRVLDVVFQTEIADHTVFKGGTSLSKGWQIIERFSEDVDLALDRSFLGFNEETPSRKQITRLRQQSKAYMLETLIPQIADGFEKAQLDVEITPRSSTDSDQDPLIIEINYPHLTEYTTYVLPRVLVEIGIRSLREPFTRRRLMSLVTDHFVGYPFADVPIDIPTVNVERTFLEKLFLLHEEFNRPKERMRVDRLSRHLYDIHQISRTPFAEAAITNVGLYKSIVEHRAVFAKMGGVNYTTHYPPHLNPLPPPEVEVLWRRDYATMQEQMIHGKSPSFEELIHSIQELSNRINGQEFHNQ